MTTHRALRRAFAAVLATTSALAAAAIAYAHANVSPPVVEAKTAQVYTLAVPTEKEGVTTTRIELTPPTGFSIDSFAPSPGWKRSVGQRGSGEEAVIQKVTWSGGHVPTDEDAVFQFLARTNSSKRYTFSVRQTYSDGSVVDWSGPESSDTPAPIVDSKSSLGGGTSTLGLAALIVGGFALVIGIAALVGGVGKRTLA